MFHNRTVAHNFEVGHQHLSHEFAQARLVPPTKVVAGSSWVADKKIGFGRPYWEAGRRQTLSLNAACKAATVEERNLEPAPTGEEQTERTIGNASHMG
jgi:hypothetical protein